MFASDPVDWQGVRVDTGVQDGGEIPMFYDSMIAKLIVHGKDRLEAIAKMREALNGFVIRGISSNIPFQAALLAHPRFVAGDFNTGFIAENYSQGFRQRTCHTTMPISCWRWLLLCTASTAPCNQPSAARCRAMRLNGGRRCCGVTLGQMATMPTPVSVHVDDLTRNRL
jgi:acetyl/propionyl-CoA carboxylase alpha subunit